MECLPIKTLEELNAWKPHPDKIRTSSEPLAGRVKRDSNVPRTLVCHDMRGGYLEDRFVQGCDNPMAYRFYHWQYIDMFVYFSHNFITIPPVTWINAGHRHGVQVLGTFITEWDDGKERCKTFLESKDSYQALADKLVHLTQYYQFDGWLINIENVIDKSQVQNLCNFVSYLTSKLHENIPGSKVIWYDSVLNTGELHWQDELNDKNCMFFDVCDGIFLNYNWKDETLNRSRSLAQSKGREMDVYVGIDVFGRGCLGGGGFNTIEALAAIRRFNMSAAIFAQGWVWEKHEKDFTAQEDRFWSLLDPLLPTCEVSMLPLCTSFCQGFGNKLFSQGEVIDDKPWYNLSLQELQPTCTNSQFIRHAEQFQPSMSLCTDESYTGGTCLHLEGKLSIDGQPLLFRLFDTCISLTEDLVVVFTYRLHSNSTCDVFLELNTKDKSGVEKCHILRDKVKSMTSPAVKVYESMTSQDFSKMFPNIDLSESDHWNTRYFCIGDMAGQMLNSIAVGLQSVGVLEKQRVKFGQLQVISKSDLQQYSSNVKISDLEVVEADLDMCKITWTCEKAETVKFYNLYSGNNDQRSLIGCSKTSTFYASPHPKDSIVVQPVFKTNFVKKM